jgi:hypothetical protein
MILTLTTYPPVPEFVDEEQPPDAAANDDDDGLGAQPASTRLPN